MIEDKNLRNYFELSFSSIYFLINQLESKGLVESYQGFGKKGVGKKGIKLTEKGQEAISAASIDQCCGKPLLSHPVDYFFYSIHHYNAQQIKAGLNRYLREAEQVLTYYQQKKNEVMQDESTYFGEQIVLDHFIFKLEHEIEWIKNLKTKLLNRPDLDQFLEKEKAKIEADTRKIILDQ
jgi:DNA-binding PadR family transcriptional regulator